MAQTKENKDDGLIRCDACPVLCRIRPEKTGACNRYGNFSGKLTRLDPVVVVQKALDDKSEVVPFVTASENWDGIQMDGPPPSNVPKGARWNHSSRHRRSLPSRD